jgi:hypothetical protein
MENLEELCQKKAEHYVKNWAKPNINTPEENWALGGAYKQGWKDRGELDYSQAFLEGAEEWEEEAQRAKAKVKELQGLLTQIDEIAGGLRTVKGKKIQMLCDLGFLGKKAE